MQPRVVTMKVPFVVCVLFVLLFQQSTFANREIPRQTINASGPNQTAPSESRDSDPIATPAMGAQWSTPTSVPGSSVRFSGDDLVKAGDIPNLAGDLTFELWLRPGDISVRRNPLAKAYSGEGNITQELSGQLTFHHGEGGGNTRGYEFLRSSPLMNDAWSHVVLTRDGQTVSWYVNGELDTQKVFTKIASDSRSPLIIGDGHTNGYDGYIDEVAVYDRALTIDEIVDHLDNIVDPTTYGYHVIDDNPIGYWRLDETAGPNALDETAANPAVYHGTPTYTQPGAQKVLDSRPIPGSSVGFSGDDRIRAGDIPNLTGDLTFELWLRPRDTSVRRNPLAKAYSGEGNITQELSGQLTFHHGEGGGNTRGYEFLRSSPLMNDAWSHVVLTRDGQTVSWYVNGELDTQKVFTKIASDSSLPLIIGDGHTNGYDGYIDEVAVYDRALTIDEIIDHFDNIIDPTTYGNHVTDDNPVGYWRLDEAIGPKAFDETATNLAVYQGTPAYTQPGAETPHLDSVIVSIDGEYFGTFSENDTLLIDPEPGLVVAESWITLSILISDNKEDVVCELAGARMNREDEDRFQIDFQPAYFVEELPLTCLWRETALVDLAVTVVSADEELDAFLANRYIPVQDDDYPGDPYSGWRQTNYYSSIYRFIEYAEVYQNPGIYGVDNDSEFYRKIERFLINGAEAFFEPCVDYDIFTAEESRQCRSTDRVGKYYLWRSPNISDVAIIHAKAEIRGAAGVAQAIKGILLRHAHESPRVCETSDNPADLRESSLYCRALNVRRLLFREIWTKWTDQVWILETEGVSQSNSIQGTPVPHYIAWAETILDLFRQTEDIEHWTTEATEERYTPESRTDFLLGLFHTDEDGYTVMSCSHPDMPRECGWLDYDLALAGGVEIGHQDITVHLLTQYGERFACPTIAGDCVDMMELARTLNERTWSGEIPALDGAVNFPKFDMFLDGYCRAHYQDEVDPLFELCLSTWVQEATGWRPHRALTGWVNLGVYDRDLMIRLRKSVDENSDGVLTDDDTRLRNFATFLIKAMAKNGRGSRTGNPYQSDRPARWQRWRDQRRNNSRTNGRLWRDSDRKNGE